MQFKNLDEIAIKTNIYLYQHFQKIKTLCRHVSRFAGPNLDLLDIRQSDTAPFCENHAKIYS